MVSLNFLTPGLPSSSTKMSKCKEAKRYLPAAVAWILLLSTTSLFFVFPARWYYEKFTIWIPIAEAFLAVIVVANFTLATFMDPGVIPKATRGEDDNDDLRAPLYKTVDVQGITVRMKWCVTCQFYRPPRCSHCSVCNNCIETFDHHCPWVNNCIGRRNYRFFFMFLMSLSIHMISIFSLCLIYLLQHMNDMSELRTIISVSIMVVITVLFLPICGLTGFHIVLVSRGRTTNEQVTGKYRGGYNPFSKGCCRNCYSTLCGPLYPGLVNAKRNISHVAVIYRSPPPDGDSASNPPGPGIKVNVYVDNGDSILKSKSNNLNLPSLHSPRRYRQLLPTMPCNREVPDHELGLQASQSLDCEPTPPMQRQGSKTNFFLPTGSPPSEPSGMSYARHMRGSYSHGSPHPNRQRSADGTRSRSETPDSLSSPEHSRNGLNVTSPSMQQKLRAIGAVPTPFAASASPVVRRSNPPTPTHPEREYMGFPSGLPPNSRVNAGPYYEPYAVANVDQRRFLSESELMYDRQYHGAGLSGNPDTTAPIRELASSPQRGVYNWKDSSPTAGPPGNANFGSLQNYFHSNPPSPVQHNILMNNSGSAGNSAVNNKPYYHSGSAPSYMLNKSVTPVSPNNMKYAPGPENLRPSPVNRRPVSFVRALEMTDSMELGNRGQPTRNSPAGTPRGPGQSNFNATSERASVYDMNYEISV